jgi:hypothetical protein
MFLALYELSTMVKFHDARRFPLTARRAAMKGHFFRCRPFFNNPLLLPRRRRAWLVSDWNLSLLARIVC